MTKRTVILSPGPLHLFWTTGVYYLWELSKSYRVALVVDEDYEHNERFAKVLDLVDVPQVLYLPRIPSVLARHRFYAMGFKDLIDRHLPTAVFAHSVSYLENMYLTHACRRSQRRCSVISYQNGMSPLKWQEAFRAREASIARGSGKRGLRARLGRMAHRARVRLSFIVNYYLAPVLFVGRSLTPPLNVETGEFRRANIDRYFDFFLTYYAVEKSALESLHRSKKGLTQIRHPVETVGAECQEAIYDYEEENLISVFPTWGLVDALAVERGISLEEIGKKVSDNWIAAMERLSEKFPGYGFVWKLHPAAAEDELWVGITRAVRRSRDDVIVAPAVDSAEEWILKSKVVVTDVSTVFWWANLLGSKLVISLDIFDYPAADDAKLYDGVLYVDSLDALSAMDVEEAASMTGAARQGLPSLTEFVHRYLVEAA